MRPSSRRCGGAGRRAILLLAALLAGALLAAPAPAAAQRPALEQALEGVVAAGAPGIVALVDDGSSTWSGARGVADRETGRRMRPALRFRIASVSKSFVATVVLQLADEGRLSLEDTVERWLPGILPYGGQVTVRQLLNHTAGVPDYALAPAIALYRGDRLRSWSPRELVALVAAQPQLFPSGSAWSYANTGYVLAGLIVERAGGRTLRQEIRRRILRPLRLRDTSFPVHRPSIPAPYARGYSLDVDDQYNPIEGPLLDFTAYDPSIVWAAGNIVSDVSDIARFYRALLGGRLLSPARLADMKRTVDIGVPGSGYGLGLIVFDTPCGPILGHNGGVPGFLNDAYRSEDGTRGLNLMVNAQIGPSAAAQPYVQAFGQAIMEALAGLPCAAEAARATPAALLAPRAAVR